MAARGDFVEWEAWTDGSVTGDGGMRGGSAEVCSYAAGGSGLQNQGRGGGPTYLLAAGPPPYYGVASFSPREGRREIPGYFVANQWDSVQNRRAKRAERRPGGYLEGKQLESVRSQWKANNYMQSLIPEILL